MSMGFNPWRDSNQNLLLHTALTGNLIDALDLDLAIGHDVTDPYLDSTNDLLN